MAWVLGAVTALALSLAFTAHADEQLGVRAEAPPVVVADSTLEPPEVPRISSRVRKDWLEALAYKVERARSALQEHRLVVTSGDREVRRYTYDDLAKSLDPAEARLAAAVAAADAPKSRIDLSPPAGWIPSACCFPRRCRRFGTAVETTSLFIVLPGVPGIGCVLAP
jgi:hypothetical protein